MIARLTCTQQWGLRLRDLDIGIPLVIPTAEEHDASGNDSDDKNSSHSSTDDGSKRVLLGFWWCDWAGHTVFWYAAELQVARVPETKAEVSIEARQHQKD